MTTEKVWNTFRAELLGFIKSRIHDQSLAEDLLQEVFIKIHTNLDSLSENANILPWIYRITRNTIIDYYRKKRFIIYQDSVQESFPEQLDESGTDFSNCLKSFVQELSIEDQDLLNKTTFGTMSQKEYAIINELGYSAVKSRSQRAKVKLKTLFVSCCAVQTDSYGNVLNSSDKNCDC